METLTAECADPSENKYYRPVCGPIGEKTLGNRFFEGGEDGLTAERTVSIKKTARDHSSLQVYKKQTKKQRTRIQNIYNIYIYIYIYKTYKTYEKYQYISVHIYETKNNIYIYIYM